MGYEEQKPPKSNGKLSNNGTLVIFRLKNTVTDDQLRKVFGEFGPIREIRSSIKRHVRKFIEFFDIRDAQVAKKAIHGKYILGSRLVVDYSMPSAFQPPVKGIPTVSR